MFGDTNGGYQLPPRDYVCSYWSRNTIYVVGYVRSTRRTSVDNKDNVCAYSRIVSTSSSLFPAKRLDVTPWIGIDDDWKQGTRHRSRMRSVSVSGQDQYRHLESHPWTDEDDNHIIDKGVTELFGY